MLVLCSTATSVRDIKRQEPIIAASMSVCLSVCLCLSWSSSYSRCNRCCMKMDHHCPWINNCVGHRNHAAFVRFLFHVIIGCSHASYIQILFLYRILFGGQYWAYRTVMSVTQMAVTVNVLAVGLCIGVTIAVGLLFVHQMQNIRRNRTDIEGWIIAKARTTSNKNNTFKFPYDLGWKKNFKSVFWTELGDGITWDIRDGCHQYTLTMEQIEQKKRKRQETYSFDVTTGYRGNWNYFGIGFGCRVMWSCPIVDEPRLRVKKGDRVMVTRIQRHWLYGNKVISHLVSNEIGNVSRPRMYSKERGWFPRICAVPSNKNA